MMDEVGQRNTFENYGLELTLEGVTSSTPGLIKRLFKLRKIGPSSDQQQ
jgi:hypothetical protein